MQQPRPGLEAAFQLAALWTAKRVRRRLQNTGANDEEFYSEFFTDEDEDVFGWDPRARQRVDTVGQAVRKHLPRGGKLLDVGCGLGEVLAGLTGSYDCFGIDYAASNVSRATRRLGNAAQIQQGSALSLPFGDASMDAVICLEVLEHLADDHPALVEMLRVLRPDGILVLAVPYTYYWPAYLKLMGHYRHYTRASLTATLDRVDCRVVEFLPNYPRWHQRYTRGFVFVKAAYIAASRLKLTKAELRQFSLRPQGEPELKRLEAALEPLRAEDARLTYAELPTSTFVVAARKDATARSR